MASTNRILLGAITGQTTPGPMPAGACHVYDVASLSLRVLDEGAPKDIGATVPDVFNEAWDIVKERYSEVTKDGTLTQANQGTIPINWDAQQTEVDFGFKFKT
ncbi:cinnamyl-alcohol dehydrogenase [Apiospora arundinis]